MIEPTALPIGLLVAAVLGLVAYGVLLASRVRTDEGGRPSAVAVYLGAVMLVMLVVALLAAGSAAVSLVEQGLGPGAGGDVPSRPVRPGTIAEEGSPAAQLWGAVATAALAGAAFELHRRWLLRIRRTEGMPGPATGAFRSYLYAVCLASLVTMVVAGGGMASGAARALSSGGGPGADLPPPRRGVPAVERTSPGGQPERGAGLAELIGNAVLAAFAFGLFAAHWRAAREEHPVGQEEEGDAARPA